MSGQNLSRKRQVPNCLILDLFFISNETFFCIHTKQIRCLQLFGFSSILGSLQMSTGTFDAWGITLLNDPSLNEFFSRTYITFYEHFNLLAGRMEVGAISLPLFLIRMGEVGKEFVGTSDVVKVLERWTAPSLTLRITQKFWFFWKRPSTNTVEKSIHRKVILSGGISQMRKFMMLLKGERHNYA